MTSSTEPDASLRDAYLRLLRDVLLGHFAPDGVLIPIRTPQRLPGRLVSGLLARRGLKVGTPALKDAEGTERGEIWPWHALTMVGRRRLDNFRYCIERVVSDEVPGDIIEAGVWRGGACIFARGVLASLGVVDRRVWLADSFAGLPAPDAARYPSDAQAFPFHEHDVFAVSVEDVRANIQRFGFLDDRVEFVQGWFKDTLPGLRNERWAVIRLDGDLYESTIQALENLWPNLSPGGFVIVDDYGAVPGCKCAVDDYREQHRIADPLEQIDEAAVFWRQTSDRRPLGNERSPSNAKLGAVVLTHGASGEFQPLVDTLVDSGVEDIVLVQNPVAAADPRPSVDHPSVSLIRAEENLGYAAGMNIGVRELLGRGIEFLLILTHDVRLKEDTVDNLTDAAGRLPSFGVLGPVLWTRGEDTPWSYGGRSDAVGNVEHILQPPNAEDNVAACDWIDGAAMLIRASVFDEVGLFDERLFIYWEEASLCFHARQAGWRVGVALDAVAEQSPGEGKRPAMFAYLIWRNGLEYARLVAGRRAIASSLCRALRETKHGLRAALAVRATPEQRSRARAKLPAMWLGVMHFFLGRWGPPPAIFQRRA